ncbi:MAG: DUF1553 domain-containing protein, partial [Planctomycetes bacterium]|nr:DUF1553 domain-containing protein [Planctomycetota bacterium]
PWLDLARYADTDGYEQDRRRSMWPYRDWVIGAFNDDMPFDRFTIEQIAGDLLSDPTKDQLIATGFHRNTMHNREGGVDQGEQRWLTLVDRVGTTGTVWLGASLECAQCHDHKFDPFSAEEFYRFLAFFDNSDEPSLNVQDPVTLERVKRLVQRIAELEKVLPELKQDTDAFKTAEKALRGLRAEANALNSMTTLILREKDGYPPVTPFRQNGSYLSPGETLSADTPGSLPPMQDRKDRLGLAKWLVSRENPLTARVVMNRLWEQYFGVGLVKTSGDFGTKGELPSHPGLLDWLAVELVEHGWSLKHMHALILGSATYRQSSRPHEAGMKADALSELLWRFPPRRLEAEAIRDSILATTGVLDLRMGGPGFDVFKPNTNYVRNYIPKDKFGPAEWRRMVYMVKVRMEQDAVFGTFDCPDAGQPAPKRSRSTTAIQALNLLNSGFMLQQAELFAARLKREAGKKTESQVQRAFQLALGRKPADEERAGAIALVKQHGLVTLCRSLLNASEFLFVP